MSSPTPFDRHGQQPIQIVSELVGSHSAGRGRRADHHIGVVGHRRQQSCHPVPQHALRAIADNGVANGLGHHQADPVVDRRRARGCHDEPRARRSSGTTTAQHCGKIRTVAQSVVRRQHCRLTGGRPVVPQAEILLRPLARRADRIERPARVRIRRRKPCTLARRRVLGWKVRLLTVVSVEMCGPTVGPIVRWSWKSSLRPADARRTAAGGNRAGPGRRERRRLAATIRAAGRQGQTEQYRADREPEPLIQERGFRACQPPRRETRNFFAAALAHASSSC